MNLKFFIVLVLISMVAFSSVVDINKKIDKNKQYYQKVEKNKKNLNKNLNLLASKILEEEKAYQKNNDILEKINTKLLLNKLRLENSLKQFQLLQDKSISLREKKSQIESDVIDFVIRKYSMSLGLEQTNKKTSKDIIDKEVYLLIFENAKDEVLNLNIDYLKVNNDIRNNIKKTNQLSQFIKEQYATKAKYLKLKKEQANAIESLKFKHKLYKEQLIKTIQKQNKLTDLLGSLNILKKKEIKKAKEQQRQKRLAQQKKQRLQKLKQQKEQAASKKQLASKTIKLSSAKDLAIKVRNLGSSAKGVKIVKYKGIKTIAPLKSYTIVKKFGKYYDNIYKMELFNESVSLKTKRPNAKVFSVFKGEIVYAKQNSGLLENVVIVKHKNNLHTIYSHLDKISPTIKVGKWIPKGYVVGRVSDTLLFQATKNSKYIDPTLLFK